MPDPNKRRRDFSIFDSMSTEELEDYLADSYMLPDEEVDMDAMVHVLGELKRRDNRDEAEKAAAIDAAWASFNRDYRPSAEDDADDPAGAVEAGREQETAQPSPVPRRRTAALRVLAAAAILIAALLCGSIVSYAAGYDLFGAVARWTRETFGFSSSARYIEDQTYPEQTSDLFLMLIENDISEAVLPRYLPEGFSLVTTNLIQEDSSVMCLCLLSDGESSISLQYKAYIDRQIRTIHEKDLEEPELYATSFADFYIMTNMGKYKTVWLYENVECSISGVPSREELIRIIDSIGT